MAPLYMTLKYFMPGAFWHQHVDKAFPVIVQDKEMDGGRSVSMYDRVGLHEEGHEVSIDTLVSNR